MGGILFVFRFLFWLLVARLALRTIGAFLGGLREPAASSKSKAGATELVRDRICNTFVPRDRAIAATVAGRTEYYCSPACRDQGLLLASRAS